MSTIFNQAKRVWNAFGSFFDRRNNGALVYYGGGNAYHPGSGRSYIRNEKSVIRAVLNQIAIDCSLVNIKHVRVNENEQYKETIKDSLNRVLTIEANVDQTGRAFIFDAVMSMLDEGCVALVPFETTENPEITDSYEVLKARAGRIVQWYPKHIQVELYNEDTGQKENIMVEKRYTPIIENPFYTTMNEPNSTMQRLFKVYSLLDKLNEEAGSDRLDVIIQLPYTIKSPLRTKQAEERLHSIENQLRGSKHGIAYIDGTEKVVQLNRPVDNSLFEQTKELKADLYNQLGFSQAIFDGTASESVLLNYYNRTIEPILTALCEEIERKWISRTAQSQGQAIRFFRDPFKLVPVAQLAEIADKFTRNEILTSNEIRPIIGIKPSEDSNADKLRNSNLNHNETQDQSNGEEDENFKMDDIIK